ncbi:phosphate ABC transporter permease subunit PstC [Streptococcus cuniculi]|uniref:Phosphate transport system permease protein n=1 Tax=Streptococcus cuniculi TaxID=1432788 RepID=A0A1Q8E9B1_9STRE|nr:phosphate ABC transporter permease subunit PstC [Streptococcus cuniculi]OLF48383.1 phosphate ABC transporter permease subunit PstC [Streptococcus cuniculi]
MRQFREVGMQAVFLMTACLSVLSVVFICIFLFSAGLPAIQKIGWGNFLLGLEWRPSNQIFGILPMIIGSVYVTVGALLIGVPIGIFTSLYLAFFCKERWYPFFKRAVSLMAGIPSVVYGFFGLVVLVPFVRQYIGGHGMGVLTASILLGIMILPTIISVSEAALRAVPKAYYQGGLALGASHERSIFFIVLPAAKRGILASIILGLGRAMGETMAVIMVAGNQALIPTSLTSGVRTLTTNIVMEMGYSTDLHREALIGTAVVLFLFILLINTTFYMIDKKE